MQPTRRHRPSVSPRLPRDAPPADGRSPRRTPRRPRPRADERRTTLARDAERRVGSPTRSTRSCSARASAPRRAEAGRPLGARDRARLRRCRASTPTCCDEAATVDEPAARRQPSTVAADAAVESAAGRSCARPSAQARWRSPPMRAACSCCALLLGGTPGGAGRPPVPRPPGRRSGPALRPVLARVVRPRRLHARARRAGSTPSRSRAPALTRAVGVDALPPDRRRCATAARCRCAAGAGPDPHRRQRAAGLAPRAVGRPTSAPRRGSRPAPKCRCSCTAGRRRGRVAGYTVEIFYP